MTEPYEKLTNGIILQAVSDYRQAMKKGDCDEQISIEKFLRSSWFSRLTTLNPEFLIQRLQKEAAV